MYDYEKYREKREKVLGVKKKRFLNFGTISFFVSLLTILGFAVLLVPGAIDYATTRNLDDVIYKLKVKDKWPPNTTVHISSINGVSDAVIDKNKTRLVITFDRTEVDTDRFISLFRKQNLEVVQLNRMNHRHRLESMKEEEDLEAL